MHIITLDQEPRFPFERRGHHVLYDGDAMKVRIVDLEDGERIPDCIMAELVLFHVLEGVVTISVDGKPARLRAGQCLISRPATLTMTAHERSRLMGVQVPGRPE